uniref:Uncharacterized protein n=1 Tax=Desulfovibrio desulfuricans (strain ATCC 27774 / DSM 6949 / MB) TaxID=525146 RepID=B8J235_DESDA
MRQHFFCVPGSRGSIKAQGKNTIGKRVTNRESGPALHAAAPLSHCAQKQCRRRQKSFSGEWSHQDRSNPDRQRPSRPEQQAPEPLLPEAAQAARRQTPAITPQHSLDRHPKNPRKTGTLSATLPRATAGAHNSGNAHPQMSIPEGNRLYRLAAYQSPASRSPCRTSKRGA